jgi:hypothetical protein
VLRGADIGWAAALRGVAYRSVGFDEKTPWSAYVPVVSVFPPYMAFFAV